MSGPSRVSPRRAGSAPRQSRQRIRAVHHVEDPVGGGGVVGRGGEHGRAGGDRGVRDDDDADADGGGAIMLRGGFVQDQPWGGGDQAVGHRDTLAFAAGQGAAAVVVLDGDPDAGQLEQPRPPCGVIEQCGRPGRRAGQRCRIAGPGDPAGAARTRRRRSARRRPRVLARRSFSA